MASSGNEQSKEATGGGGDGERPDDGSRDGGRHDRRHLPREGQGEQRGERPHGAPRPLPRRGPGGRPLVVPEAAEEEEQGGVRTWDEEDGGRVAPRAVHGQAGVEGEDAEARFGDPGRREVRHGWEQGTLCVEQGTLMLTAFILALCGVSWLFESLTSGRVKVRPCLVPQKFCKKF